MDLIADVGNTRVHLALFDGEALALHRAVAGGEPAALRRGLDAALAAAPRPARVALVHVAPRPAEVFAAWARERFGLEARVLGADLPVPIPLEVAAPQEVGPDRLANATWAARTYPGRAAVVVDAGTAITFDVVDARGAFVGGLIAPGLRLGARALASGTARLPEVEPLAEPPPVLGGRTREAIEGGLLWGAIGLITEATARIAAALGEAPEVVATGGDAARLAPHCPAVRAVVPTLTLEGVRFALQEAAP